MICRTPRYLSHYGRPAAKLSFTSNKLAFVGIVRVRLLVRRYKIHRRKNESESSRRDISWWLISTLSFHLFRFRVTFKPEIEVIIFLALKVSSVRGCMFHLRRYSFPYCIFVFYCTIYYLLHLCFIVQFLWKENSWKEF